MLHVKLIVLWKLLQDATLRRALNPPFATIVVGLIANIATSNDGHEINHSRFDKRSIARINNLTCYWVLFGAIFLPQIHIIARAHE